MSAWDGMRVTSAKSWKRQLRELGNNTPWGEPIDLSNSYSRHPCDDQPPLKEELLLCSMDAARSAYKTQDLDFDSKKVYMTGVRGTPYHLEALSDRNLWGEQWFDLHPEPGNVHDPDALAVDLRGQRIGYIAASQARHYQPHVRLHNHLGRACRAPGFICDPYGVWIVLPTLQEMEKLLHDFDPVEEVKQLYLSLPSEIREQVRKEHFQPSAETIACLVEALPNAHHLLPTQHRDDSLSVWWYRAIHRARHEEAERRSLLRQQERERLRAEKEAKRKDAEKLKRARDERIVHLASQGVGTREIAAAMGCSEYTVKRVRRSTGLQATGGSSEWHIESHRKRIERGVLALQLQETGMTRRQIAEKMGLGVSSVKKLMADERFFRNPESNPDRYSRARAAASGLPEIHSRIEEQARRDLAELVERGWLMPPRPSPSR